MLLDANILIDFMRGNQKASDFLTQTDEFFSTSVLVVMEVIRGGAEKTKINVKNVENLLLSLDIEILNLDSRISELGYELFRNNYHKLGIDIADAFIAATAIVYNEPLVTLNIKHFKNIPVLTVLKPY